ncbi:DUF1572 family protein [Bacillus cereus]
MKIGKNDVFLFKTIKELQTKDLLKIITIRNNPLTVLEVIQIEIAHCSNHLGQILYIGKQIKGVLVQR